MGRNTFFAIGKRYIQVGIWRSDGKETNRIDTKSGGQGVRLAVLAEQINVFCKGEIEPAKVVDTLIDKMEEYANYGFAHMHEQLENNPNCYFKDSAFLNEILPFATGEKKILKRLQSP